MLHRFFTSPNGHFVRHYAEMVIAMLLGMLLLGLPAEGALVALGSSTSELQREAPALALLGMAIVMTVPMVAWMRHRGHGWRPNAEMAASMFLPTFAVIGVMWTGLNDDFGLLMMVEHAAMLPAMLVAMLLRFDEYAACGHHHAAATT